MQSVVSKQEAMSSSTPELLSVWTFYLGQIRSFKGSQHHMNMILTSKQIEFLKYMFFLESVQNTFCWTKSNRCIVIDYF